MSSGVRSRVRRARAVEMVAKVVTGMTAYAVIGIVLFILGYIFSRGAGAISWEFLSQPPRMFMTQGGIWPAIYGTLSLVLWAGIFALPIGIMAGVYLAEYATHGRFTRMIRLSIANMAGVPSIVYGLFGLSLFVLTFGFGRSIIEIGRAHV